MRLMFNPTSRSDRLNYGSIILPDAGYHLEKAVGTSYSLDLETLVAVAIKIGLVQESGEDFLGDLTGMLAALNKVSDKMIVFCEAGQIKKTRNAKPLFLLLEKIVVPVTVMKKNQTGRYASFHPKFWLLQYADNEGNYRYRLIILSRNLTFDHSWDVAVSFDGKEYASGDMNTVNIQFFLDFLKDQINDESRFYDEHINLISEMRTALSNVRFELSNDLFDSFDFLPLGIDRNGSSINKPFFEFTNSGLFIISPFISKSIIERLSDNCDTYDMTLITRKAEISKIADDRGYGFDVYIVRDDVVNGESGLSEYSSNDENESTNDAEKNEYKQQDIHAKLYLLTSGKKADLYLGSANASYNSLNYNVETLVCLHSRTRVLNCNSLFQDVIGDENRKDCPFEKVDFDVRLEDADDDEVEDLELVIKEVCRLQRNAIVEEQSDGLFTVRVDFAEYKSPYNITITPFLYNAPREFAKTTIFTDCQLINLSEFYSIAVASEKKKVERIIIIPTEGIPEMRNGEIVRSVIRNQREFIEYISFLLDEDYLRALYEKKELHNSGFYKNSNMMPAIYEKMLHSAYENPEKIRDIQGVLNLLDGDDDRVPEDFVDLFSTFCSVLGIDSGAKNEN